MSDKREKVYTSQFWRLSFSALLFITSFNMVVPELNNIMRSFEGQTLFGFKGNQLMGFTITLFASAALLARPFSGKLVDSIGRKTVIIIGATVCVILGLLYGFAASLFSFLCLRFFHGFSTGFTPVGNTSYIADISPINRRGESLGVMGMVASLGFAIGPMVGSFVANIASVDVLFFTSSGVAMLSILLVSSLPETSTNVRPFKLDHLKVNSTDLFEPKALLQFLIMTLTIFSFGAILIIIFDHAESVGFTGKEKSIFFTINVFTSLGIRFFAGKLSDRIGRRPVMMIGTSAAIIGLAILSMAKTQTEFFIGSVFYGMASGFNSPTLFAWAIDVSDPNRIGRAMSTLFIGVELGVIAGSLCAGLIYQNNLDNIPTIHITSLICSSSALLLLVLARSRKTT